MRNHVPWLCVVGIGALATGCGAGALGQAVTQDSCEAGDLRCARAFDAPIALGATAAPETHLTLDGSTSPGFHYESAAPSILEVDGGRVVGRSEGTSALLFVSDASTVLDFLHVWVKKPTALELDAALPGRTTEGRVDGTIDVLVGEELRLSARPIAGGQRLLGAGESTWSVDPPILSLLREGDDARRRVVAASPGTATLRVEMLGVTSTMQIVVRPRAGTAEISAPSRKRGAS